MFLVTQKRNLNPEVMLLKVKAPEIANKVQPGQFVIVKVDEVGERIPLTVAESNKEDGTLTIIFQTVGKTTKKLADLDEGGFIQDLVGPLGRPTEIANYGQVVCVAGGVGAAIVMPVAYAMKKAGNKVATILGARTSSLLLLEDELRQVSNDFFITTDDGSKGRHGLVTDVLKEILEKDKPGLVVAIGPAIMMKFVCQLTKSFEVHTTVSLNPIMVDGTGMCGACRVEVGGKTKFACADGPEFDGHQVDFDLLMARQRMYLEEEKQVMEDCQK